MSEFGSKSRLADIYREGRGLQKPTLALVDMGGDRYTPVEVVLKHMPNDETLGAFWFADIRDILDLAELEFDEEAKNPNLVFLGKMFREMTILRHNLGQPLPERKAPAMPASLQKFAL